MAHRFAILLVLLAAAPALPRTSPATLEDAVKTAEQEMGRSHQRVAEALENLAEAHRLQGRMPEAEKSLRRALEIRRAGLGKDHRLTRQTERLLLEVIRP
ncbi:MAG: tetratricopeptide repeat protein [Acidimicrobiia bacterium]|nr:tetratricopeptide repeat protein [Acidimicrobiia bacterium]